MGGIIVTVIGCALLSTVIADTCSDGGYAPCSLGCMSTTDKCISDSCCAAGKIVPDPNTSCVDKLNPSTGVSDCPRMASYCTNSVYYTLMTDQCPKTCNRCGGSISPPSTSCVDKLNPSTGVSDCPNRAYLCNDSVYYSLMTDQCPKTCGRCPSG